MISLGRLWQWSTLHSLKRESVRRTTQRGLRAILVGCLTSRCRWVSDYIVCSYSIGVSILACHVRDPGSIPGNCAFFSATRLCAILSCLDVPMHLRRKKRLCSYFLDDSKSSPPTDIKKFTSKNETWPNYAANCLCLQHSDLGESGYIRFFFCFRWDGISYMYLH